MMIVVSTAVIVVVSSGCGRVAESSLNVVYCNRQ